MALLYMPCLQDKRQTRNLVDYWSLDKLRAAHQHPVRSSAGPLGYARGRFALSA
jgi:hypothetical protein